MKGVVLRVVVASLVMLAAVSSASAHPRTGTARGYTSTVKEIRPSARDVEARVLGGDDRLEVTNRGRRELVVIGYDGEPFVRIDARGVYENVRSPATYQSRDRFALVTVPSTADPNAPPEWKKVADGDSYDWHDHRIHWMSGLDAPVIVDATDRRHHIFNWQVPGTVDGARFTIVGSLDWAPPQGRSRLVLIAPIVALLALAGVAAFWLDRRARVQDSEQAP